MRSLRERLVSVPGHAAERPVNMLTVDVEDYFHANGLAVPPERWEHMPGRVDYSTRRLLHLFDEHAVRGTFFVLGWVARRYPELVREIAARGHEIASHGTWHRLVYEQTPEQFRDDVVESKELLEDLTGRAVLGYRAPSFSIVPRSRWALPILRRAGFAYDSSIYPVRRGRYGDPDAPLGPYVPELEREPDQREALLEVPPTALELLGRNVPVAGGGYLRAYPMRFTLWALHRINEREGRSAVVYVHPWEIDPDQPQMPATAANRFRHYLNLHRTEDRLVTLFQELRFAPVCEVLGINQPPLADRIRASA